MTVIGAEQFPGELDTLRADNSRLRRLLQLSEGQALRGSCDQAMPTAPESPISTASSPAEKVRFLPDISVVALMFTRYGGSATAGRVNAHDQGLLAKGHEPR